MVAACCVLRQLLYKSLLISSSVVLVASRIMYVMTIPTELSQEQSKSCKSKSKSGNWATPPTPAVENEVKLAQAGRGLVGAEAGKGSLRMENNTTATRHQEYRASDHLERKMADWRTLRSYTMSEPSQSRPRFGDVS
jgi:hypothetical protein